jgi:hypothetical protein
MEKLNTQDDDPAAAAQLLMHHQPHGDTIGIELWVHCHALGCRHLPGTIPSTRAIKFEFRDDAGVAFATFFLFQFGSSVPLPFRAGLTEVE